MPKSQKRKTVAKKRKKKMKANTNKRRNVGSYLESTTELKQGVDSVTEDSEIKIDDFVDVSEERASIISIVNDLEGQIDTAYELKEALEADLKATRKKLSEESAARAQLEEQIKPLESQGVLVEQLREDLSFADEERNKLASSLAEAQQQLEAVTKERDSLSEKASSVEAQAKELEDEKTNLEAQVMNLKDEVADMGRLRGELTKVTAARRDLAEQVRVLSNRLEASDTSKKALERDLAMAHEQVESLRGKITDADSRMTTLRAQLEQQQATNRDLMETNTRLESELKALTTSCQTTKNELEAFKKALRDIRSEATRTSGRTRKRYFRPKNKE